MAFADRFVRPSFEQRQEQERMLRDMSDQMREEELYGPQDPDERLQMQGHLGHIKTHHAVTPDMEGRGGPPHVPAQHMRQFENDHHFDQMMRKYQFGDRPEEYDRRQHMDVFEPESFDLLNRLDAYQRYRSDKDAHGWFMEHMMSSPERRWGGL